MHTHCMHLAILYRSSDNRADVKCFINDDAVSSAHNLVARQVDYERRWLEVRADRMRKRVSAGQAQSRRAARRVRDVAW